MKKANLKRSPDAWFYLHNIFKLQNYKDRTNSQLAEVKDDGKERWMWPQKGKHERRPVVMGQFCLLTAVLVMQIYTRDEMNKNWTHAAPMPKSWCDIVL